MRAIKNTSSAATATYIKCIEGVVIYSINARDGKMKGQ